MEARKEAGARGGQRGDGRGKEPRDFDNLGVWEEKQGGLKQTPLKSMEEEKAWGPEKVALGVGDGEGASQTLKLGCRVKAGSLVLAA